MDGWENERMATTAAAQQTLEDTHGRTPGGAAHAPGEPASATADAGAPRVEATTAALRDLLAQDLSRDVLGTGEEHTATAPWTGEDLLTFRRATGADVERAFARARVAQRAWSQRSVRSRAAVADRLHRLVRDHEELLLDVIQAETGKTRTHAYDEVLEVYNCCRFTAAAAPAALKSQRVTGALPVLTRTQVDRLPVGVVGIISPWNYPAALGLGDEIAALVAGNAVVHKPDSQTTLTAILLRRLALAAGLPEDVWILVPGDPSEVGPAMVAGADGLHFTGSTKAGRSIAAEAAVRLIPVGLELGGKNAAIVCADADIDRAVEGLLRGCFSSAGQLCLSIERIYVLSEVYDAFAERFAAAAAAMTIGPGFGDDVDMGSLTSARQLETVLDHVEDAKARGATVLAGGRARPDIGPLFVEPTVLADVPASAKCAAKETFGPVVSLYRVGSDAEAIAAANATPYGLSASVWSGSGRHGRAVAGLVEAGMVNVNEAIAAAFGSVAAPSGGMRDSGLGHRHGVEGLREFTHIRTIAHQRGIPLAPFGPLDRKRFRAAMTTGLEVMRALRMR